MNQFLDRGLPTSLKWRGFGSAPHAVDASSTMVTARCLGFGASLVHDLLGRSCRAGVRFGI